jgi:transcriptional regulator with XRE-family HTH domain
MLIFIHVCVLAFMNDKERFARLIKEARGSRTKVEFARLVGVSHTTIGSWEAGERLPDRENLVMLAPVLGYSLEELQTMITGKPLSQKKVSPLRLDKVKKEIDSLPTNDQLEVFKFLSDRVVQMVGSK